MFEDTILMFFKAVCQLFHDTQIFEDYLQNTVILNIRIVYYHYQHNQHDKPTYTVIWKKFFILPQKFTET